MYMKSLKRVLCWILAVTMVLGLVPSTVLATGSTSFKDVKDGDWFKEAVDYVTAEGLMVGVGGNKFDPNGQTTRAMVVTVLHRMEGTPTASSAGFDDVAKNFWYTDAINWAQANGIVQGYGDGTFRPDVTMTREEMVAVFYRYSKHKGYDTTATNTLSTYSDHKTIQKYAVNAMNWAVSVGLITGFPDGTIRPQGESTRAQLATVLMRFAEIEVAPDDGKDEEDTEVSVDDKSLLSASTYEALAESATDVVFYVNSTLTVPYFELFIDGETTGIYLYDDGAYADSGDDIPNDGCYTGTYVIDLDIEDDIIFSAKATVGETIVCTNEVSIFVYYELTDEQCDEMDDVSMHLRTIIEETKANNALLSDVEIVELIHDKIMVFLIQLESDGVVYNIHDDVEHYYISFMYVSTNISSGVVYFSEEDKSEIPEDISDVYISNLTGSNTSVQMENNDAKSVSINLDYITYKEQSLLLCHTASSNTWRGGTFPDTTNNLSGLLEKAGFDVDARYNVTVDDFKNMQDYAFIAVECHGSYYGTWVGPFAYEETPVICTDQQATKVNRKTYSADLKKHRLADVLPKGATNNTYWIRPSFFDFYYKDDEMKANVISLGCCLGAYSSELVDSLRNAGAETVYAYSDTVYQAYDYYMSGTLVERLIAGDNVDEALNVAKIAHGEDDLVWGAAQATNGNTNFNTLKSERAVCNSYGSGTTLIHKSLQNGSFDAYSDILGNKVTGWRKHGDVRSIFRLAGLAPKSPNKMVIISSGFGSMNDETTSCIYQTILVPENVNTLTFSYDVVSEEPMEYVGSEFDDIFQVDILSTDGKILKTLVHESVNISTWYAVDGINFPNGDDTTYHTRWQTTVTDAIAEYRGQLIVLRFAVQDTGDAIYDTAVLIDSVSIS